MLEKIACYYKKVYLMVKLKFYTLPLLVFFLLLGAFIYLSYFDFNWQAMRPAPCMPKDCFCELLRLDSSIRQWVNTWSNFSFVFFALMIWGRRRAIRSEAKYNFNMINTSHAMVAAYAISLLLIGLSSWFFHASLSFVGAWADLQSMYLLAIFIILYNLVRMEKLPKASFLWAYLFMNLICGLFQFYYQAEFGRELFALLVAIATILEIYIQITTKVQINKTLFWRALVILIIAFGIWILDRYKILCIPHSLLQGHALWHLLCSLSAWFIFLYYSSEERVKAPTYT